MTNYLTYVNGKRGKADPKKSKIYIGWVNQQGGQVVIGGLATAGPQLAVKYVNDELGGVGGHPVALVTCFIKSNEEEGTTCGQKLVNDKRISVIASGAVATGAQSFFATIRGAKPVVTGVAVTPVDGAQKNAIVLFGDAAAHPAAVRHVRQERPQGQDRGGRLSAGDRHHRGGAGDREGLEAAGITTRRSATHRVRPT